MLAEAPDDMEVYVAEFPALGGFLFKPACIAESGIVEFPANDEGDEDQGRGFIIMQHGATCTEGDEPEEDQMQSILN